MMSTSPSSHPPPVPTAVPDSIAPVTLPDVAAVQPPPGEAATTLPVIPAAASTACVPVNPKPALRVNPALGTVELRTSAEDQELLECESILWESWGYLARMGEALLRIRDRELYKNDYDTFEDYCRQRWGFGRSQASRYISGAEVQKLIGKVQGLPPPRCEAQVRPLVGLPQTQAINAWMRALSWSKDGEVPGIWVKRAVKQVLREEPITPVAQAQNAEKQERFRLRQSVRTGLSELLGLLFADAKRDVLIGKVQEIERLLEPLLNGKRKRLVTNRPPKAS